jgi:RNA polymerase sigma factor (TIGR02999 family)
MAHGVDSDAKVAALLLQCSEGEREAFKEAFAHLYEDVHALARRELRGERALTLRPTALVHEAYLRMEGMRELRLNDRAHLLAMAARVMRQALVDAARRSRAGKRDRRRVVTLCDEHLGGAEDQYDALELDELLTELEAYDAVAAQIVTLRVFGGLSIEEAAQALDVSVATVNRRWLAGKSWLTHELSRA